jgi:hypothetical protein
MHGINYLLRIEMRRPWYLDILEKMLMALSRDRCSKLDTVGIVEIQVAINCHIAVWRIRCYHKKEGLISLDSIVQESICLFSKNIRRIATRVVSRWIVISLETAVQVLIFTIC